MNFKKMLSAAVVATFAATVAQAEADVTLRWGHYLTDSQYLQSEKDFAAAVTERTEGRVKIDVTYAGGLGAGNEVLTLAGRGAIDMASVVPGYYPDQLLFWRVFQLPFTYSTPREAMELAASAYETIPAFGEELDKFGVTFLFQQPLGAYYLTGSDAGCDTVAGLAGKKIRSFGSDIPSAHESIGAVPVSISVGDIYEGLERGSLDYSFINRGNVLSNRLYEPAKYSCGPIMAIAGHLIVINNDKWADISEADQAIMLEEAKIASGEYIDNIEAGEDAAGAAITADGGEIKAFPASELAMWAEKAPNFLQNWVDDMTSRGLGEAAEATAALIRAATGDQ
jgi:TRAP-type C4-dicarboxylate transport system substrate-binding protein